MPNQTRGTRDAPGGVSVPVLAASTIALIVGVGALFFLARAPLADALGLDRLAPSTADAADDAEATAEAPQAPPGEATVRRVDPQWNLPRVQAAVKAGGEALEALIPQARDEIAEIAPLDNPDAVRADRAKRQFDTWGRTWINRLRTIAKDLPSEEECAVHVSMAPKCRELRLALAEAAHAPRESSLDGATARLDGTAERVEHMLRPPPPEEPDDGGEDEGEDDEEDSPESDPG